MLGEGDDIDLLCVAVFHRLHVGFRRRAGGFRSDRRGMDTLQKIELIEVVVVHDGILSDFQRERNDREMRIRLQGRCIITTAVTYNLIIHASPL